MNFGDEDGYDAHCVNCGAGYHFDIGPSLCVCPNCGKRQDQTDEQAANERAYQARAADEWDSGQTIKEQLLSELDSMDFWLDDILPTRDEQVLRQMIEELRRAVTTSNLKPRPL